MSRMCLAHVLNAFWVTTEIAKVEDETFHGTSRSFNSKEQTILLFSIALA